VIRRRTLLGFLALVIALSATTPAAAAATGWSQYGFDARHTGFNAAETTLGSSNVDDLVHAFAARTLNGSPTTQAIVVNGVAYVGSGDMVYAFDAATGAPRWSRLDCSAPAQATSLAYAEGRVWVGDDGGDFAGYDADTGEQAFCDDFGGSILTPPAAAGGRLFVGNDIGSLFAVDAGSATVQWGVQLRHALNTPSLSDGFLYVSSDRGDVVKLRASDGTTVWRRHIDACCLSAVTVGHGLLYVGGSRLFALDPSTGAVRWAALGIGVRVTTPALAYGEVFVGAQDPNFGIAAFDARTGKRLWHSDGPGEVFAPLVVANGVAYVVGDGQPGVQMFDTGTGELLASKANPRGLAYSTQESGGPVVVDGRMYVPTANPSGPNVLDAWSL
jgi:outer membrane protein assembly factor BamB